MMYHNRHLSPNQKLKPLIHGDADDINPLSDAQTFLSQLDDKGKMITMPNNGHMWTETEEQKEFLINNITEFLLENVI